jgi:hemerythrin-like metal-binding protein
MSELFTWDPLKYSVKVPDMDREHQTLIRLMNTVYALHESGATRPVIGRALGELVSYTRRHFADEEAYMAQIGYADLPAHARIHGQMLERAGTFVADFERSGNLSEEFFNFLKFWLKSHIRGIDIKYGT